MTEQREKSWHATYGLKKDCPETSMEEKGHTMGEMDTKALGSEHFQPL